MEPVARSRSAQNTLRNTIAIFENYCYSQPFGYCVHFTQSASTAPQTVLSLAVIFGDNTRFFFARGQILT